MYCSKQMPTGRTHDQITLQCLPLLGGMSLLLSRSPGITLGLCSAFLFSGFMFGPDLDVFSIQFQRWGLLKVIWLPYQKIVPHRSWLSHGPLIGTTVRLVYLGGWLACGWGLIWAIAHFLLDLTWPWQSGLHWFQKVWQQYPKEGIALLVGLELGAMSHSLSDWLSSLHKRFFKVPRSPRNRRANARHRP